MIDDFRTDQVIETYGVTPRQFIDVKALMGDSSDNIPGVPKVGEKTAISLIKDYGSVDGVYLHLDEIKKPALHRNLEENEDQARMSLFLVTIKTDCDVELDTEKAKAEGYYTREAFELCTELGFKNFLSRFDRDVIEEKEEDTEIHIIDDVNALTALQQGILAGIKAADDHHTNAADADHTKAADARNKDAADDQNTNAAETPIMQDGQKTDSYVIGIWPLQDRAGYGMKEQTRLLGAALVCDAEDHGKPGQNGVPENYFIRVGEKLSSEDLISFLKDIRIAVRGTQENAVLALFSHKDHMPLWGIDPANEFREKVRMEGIMDLLVCCYLLNPLKNDYEIEDVASEYLGQSLQSRKQLFNKKTWAEAMEDETDTVIGYACRAAQVLHKTALPVRAKLEEQQMWSLYTQIERPLTFILSDMERLGIRIQPEALRAYSESLGGRIDELEQQIYKETGETFNIASPKQLGETVFEKMDLPGGKKTKTGYSTAAGWRSWHPNTLSSMISSSTAASQSCARPMRTASWPMWRTTAGSTRPSNRPSLPPDASALQIPICRTSL